MESRPSKYLDSRLDDMEKRTIRAASSKKEAQRGMTEEKERDKQPDTCGRRQYDATVVHAAKTRQSSGRVPSRG